MIERLWPLPALVVWLLAWGMCLALRQADVSLGWQMVLPAALGLGAAWWPQVAGTRWRAVFVAGGFPVSAALLSIGGPATGAGAWVWLLPLVALLLAYPMRTWRDAPLFPTPPGALQSLPQWLPLPPGARLLDAGCGAGQGLLALHAAYPQAQCEGIEWSWPLGLWCRWRCPWARVYRGDMWAHDWSAYDVVYVFQRPESMPRIWDKARSHMKPGARLVSLAFEVPGVAPLMQLGDQARGSPRAIWVYDPHAHPKR